MAAFPVGNFKVKVKGSDSNTLSGKLTLATTNQTNSATFKSQDDTLKLSWTTNASNQGVIGWTYTDNQQGTHEFQGGVYTPGNPNYNDGSFSGGTVNTDDTLPGARTKPGTRRLPVRERTSRWPIRSTLQEQHRTS